MIDNKIDNLFNAIETSSEYQEYLKIGRILDKDKSIMELIDKIKNLQQEAVILEYNNDPKVEELNKEIDALVKELYKKPIYQEYLNKLNEFNDLLTQSSHMLEQYVNDKI